MPAALIVAVLPTVPAAVGRTTTVTTFTSPAASVPSAHETPALHPSAETSSTPAGSASPTVTPLTLSGPLLRTTSVYVSGWPTVPVADAPLASTDRSESEYAS